MGVSLRFYKPLDAISSYSFVLRFFEAINEWNCKEFVLGSGAAEEALDTKGFLKRRCPLVR